MRKAVLAVLAAMAFGAATPANAVNMFWTYGSFASVEDCLSRAARALGDYSATGIERGDNHVLGVLEPNMLVTLFCLPSSQGATGLLTVAADHEVSADNVANVRREIWALFRRT